MDFTVNAAAWDSMADLEKGIERNGGGISKPEPLKENLRGFWSRRIVSHIMEETGDIQIDRCKGHFAYE